MRHDWIFDVLADLRSYALQNDLQALAGQVESAIATARAEVGMQGRASGHLKRPEDGGQGGVPPSGRAH
jgi:hypothetical protein